MRDNFRPKVIGDFLTFAACPLGCDGEGSSIHTAHRIRELGHKDVPNYLEKQIREMLLFVESEIDRLRKNWLTSNGRKRARLESIAEREHARATLLRAWISGAPLPRGPVLSSDTCADKK